MIEVTMTKRMKKSMPEGPSLLNVIEERYYAFTVYWGNVYKGQFVNSVKYAIRNNYEYILDREVNKLFKITFADRNAVMKGKTVWIKSKMQ